MAHGTPVLELAKRRSSHVRQQDDGVLVIRTVATLADTNPAGDIFGGWLISHVDLAAGNMAGRVSQSRSATVSVDAMQFLRPVKVGDVVTLYATLAGVGRTSMSTYGSGLASKLPQRKPPVPKSFSWRLIRTENLETWLFKIVKISLFQRPVPPPVSSTRRSWVVAGPFGLRHCKRPHVAQFHSLKPKTRNRSWSALSVHNFRSRACPAVWTPHVPTFSHPQRMSALGGRTAISALAVECLVWVAPALQVFSALIAAVRQYCRVFGLFTQPLLSAAGLDEFRKQGSYRLNDLGLGRDIRRSVLAFG